MTKTFLGLCLGLSGIARDGEGANCLIEVLVEGTKNDSDALTIAKKITNSSLVKTANDEYETKEAAAKEKREKAEA